jgi:hypothetical protein
MPNKNGTGPTGNGPKTGRGLGACENNSTRRGASCGQGRGRGLERNTRVNENLDEKTN